jgi:predicted helicase
MREHLEKDFDAIYVLDLGGNVRKKSEAVRDNAQRLWHSGRSEHQ